jgi:hypothetical protein
MFAGLSPGLDYDFAMLRLVLLALLPQIGGILLLVGRSLLGGEGTASRIRQCRHGVRIWAQSGRSPAPVGMSAYGGKSGPQCTGPDESADDPTRTSKALHFLTETIKV